MGPNSRPKQRSRKTGPNSGLKQQLRKQQQKAAQAGIRRKAVIYQWRYKTPDGFSDLCMNSDGDCLTGLWFEKSEDTIKHVTACEEKELPVFRETCRWLDLYFEGKNPDFMPKYTIKNLTPFRRQVIEIMKEIPFGETVTYGDIAKKIAENRGIGRMSAQAVGGAVGWNPLCILIPCHRVVGADGSLTGYGGGIKNKAALLAHEEKSKAEWLCFHSF